MHADKISIKGPPNFLRVQIESFWIILMSDRGGVCNKQKATTIVLGDRYTSCYCLPLQKGYNNVLNGAKAQTEEKANNIGQNSNCITPRSAM